MCEILQAPFKSGVSISYSPPALPHTSPAGFQNLMFWGLVFPVQDPQAGELHVGPRPLIPLGRLLQM